MSTKRKERAEAAASAEQRLGKDTVYRWGDASAMGVRRQAGGKEGGHKQREIGAGSDGSLSTAGGMLITCPASEWDGGTAGRGMSAE